MMVQTPKQLDPFNWEQLPVSPKWTLVGWREERGYRKAFLNRPRPALPMERTSLDQFQYDYALLKILLLTARVPLAFPGAIKRAPGGGESANSPPPAVEHRQAITPSPWAHGSQSAQITCHSEPGQALANWPLIITPAIHLNRIWIRTRLEYMSSF